MASAEFHAMVAMFEEAGSPIRDPDATIDQMRAPREGGAGMLPDAPGTRYEQVDADGVRCEIVEAPDVHPGRWVLHLHGGGYILGGLDTHRSFVSHLSAASRSRVVNVDYRLAPEACYPAAVDDATAAYRWLLKTGADAPATAVTGDSAGGGLAVATLVRLRDDGDPLPGAAVVVSPWVDLTCSGVSMADRASADPMINPVNLHKMAAAYLAGGDLRSPLASPLFADLAGLPPLLAMVGGREVLVDDAVRLDQAARAAGVDAELDVWDEMFHVWPIFAAVLPEGRDAIDRIARFLEARLPAST